MKLTMLAYLPDIFSTLTKLNLALQGKATTIFNVLEGVAALKAKILSLFLP